ncbi:hypothetical protein [Streptomyces flaveolus]|uniref:hypothetical protein n=1 Tax=Streptomyces flaveolus TaxID=67297 RepID=UPI0036FE0307
MRDTYDYAFVDWLYGPTALSPEDEPAMFSKIPLDSARVESEPVDVPLSLSS